MDIEEKLEKILHYYALAMTHSRERQKAIKEILATLAEGAPELNLSDKQILRLLPAQALIDFNQAENTLKTLWKMAWNDISAHYQARIALLEAEIERLKAQLPCVDVENFNYKRGFQAGKAQVVQHPQ